MQVFRPDQSEHTLSLFPREYITQAVLVIINDLTQVSQSIPIDCVTVDDHLQAPFAYTFNEGDNCTIRVKKTTGELLFLGRAFATNAPDLQNYKLSNEY